MPRPKSSTPQLFETNVRSFTPSAASALLERGTWSSDDLTVRIASSCQTAHLGPDERCISLRDAPGDPPPSPEAKRARFLAWAASHAKVVDLGTPSRARSKRSARAKVASLALARRTA